MIFLLIYAFYNLKTSKTLIMMLWQWFFEGFQRRIFLILFLFSMKHSYLLMGKIIPEHNNHLLRSIKSHILMEHLITSSIPKMTLMAYTSLFVGKFSKKYNALLIFHDSIKHKIVWIRITTFFKRRASIILWSFSS